MQLQQLYSKVRQAIDCYAMIEAGDRIALGVSGGKDSLALLYALAGIRKFYPKSFELVAITVNLGYGDNYNRVRDLSESLGVEYYEVNTDIAERVTEGGCSLCARLRKGALTDMAGRLNCNSIAYAHNMDDVVETMLLSLIYEGRFSSFWPVTHYEDRGIKLIRPLVFTSQAQVKGFANKYKLPIVENGCPYNRESERAYVRGLLETINKHAPGVKNRMMTAITDGTIGEWTKNVDFQK